MNLSKRNSIASLLKATAPLDKAMVCGWVKTKRESKNVVFIHLFDGTTLDGIQLVVEDAGRFSDLLKNIHTGAALVVEGPLRESPAKGQKWELAVASLELVGEADTSYPLQKKGHSLEFLREVAHLRPRTNTFSAVFRLRSVLGQAVHRFFAERGFHWAHTPILTSNDCEGAGELFTVTTLGPEDLRRGADFSEDFFGKKAHLTVSGQLEAEFLATSLGKVYTFAPTFRSENSNTTRHLAEFWMIEPEVAFADLEENAQLAEDFTKYLIQAALESSLPELEFFAKFYKARSPKDFETFLAEPFARVSYTEAIDILKKSGHSFEFAPEWGKGLQTEHEKFLCEKTFGKPALVMNYPKDAAAFYMRENEDGRTVANMDLLVPGIGELIGGSQREERISVLEDRMAHLGVPKAGLEWYLDLRRFGTVPHAGFGMGFERLVMFLSGMQNIRDVIMCPRAPKSIAF